MTKRRTGEVPELGPNGVQQYLKDLVPLYGGMVEHFTSPGKKGVEDLIITWPASGWGRVHFVETKTIGGEVKPWQERVHAERRAFKVFTKVIWTKEMALEYCKQYGIAPRTDGKSAPDGRARAAVVSDYKRQQANGRMAAHAGRNSHGGLTVCDMHDDESC